MEIVKDIENGDYVFALKGKFTFSDNAAFRTVLGRIPDSAIRQIIFDVKDLEFVDSAALGMFLLAHDEAVKHKKTVIIRGAQGQVKKMISMARFENYFTIT